jgi:hypothetical protein
MRAVLIFYYKVFKEEPVLVFSSRENILYYWNRLQELFHINTPPRRKEPVNPLPPEFTMAEIQYQVDEMLFRMNALAGVSNLPEKPSMYFTDSDTTCGGGFIGAEDAVSSGGSEVRAFEEDKFENRMQKLKDNLFVHDPHLAQLLQLDSMGATVMEEDTEKRLMMQLELEIFRQLQMKRCDNRAGDSSDIYAISGSSTNPPSQVSNPIPSTSPGSGPTSSVDMDDQSPSSMLNGPTSLTSGAVDSMSPSSQPDIVADTWHDGASLLSASSSSRVGFRRCTKPSKTVRKPGLVTATVLDLAQSDDSDAATAVDVTATSPQFSPDPVESTDHPDSILLSDLSRCRSISETDGGDVDGKTRNVSCL